MLHERADRLGTERTPRTINTCKCPELWTDEGEEILSDDSGYGDGPFEKHLSEALARVREDW